MNKEDRIELLSRSGGYCFVCGRPMANPQFAHRIANTKANRAKFGSLVIDSLLNGELVCSLRCNDVMNIGNKPIECLCLAERIYSEEIRKKRKK